ILSKKLNKKIILTSQKDPSLLGGLVAQVGGWTFDDSLKAHLSKLEEILK
ncbi:MAG: F0F1 ATP synthase subunit delta, partial [Pseudobdellovibrionaceae bacterium]